jgi:hypothetical protein
MRMTKKISRAIKRHLPTQAAQTPPPPPPPDASEHHLDALAQMHRALFGPSTHASIEVDFDPSTGQRTVTIVRKYLK